MNVAIVTDSTAYLPVDLVASQGIRVVPLHVVVGGKAFREGVDITTAEVAAALRTFTPVSTSRPSPQQFLEATRPQAEQSVKADLALRAVAAAESIDVADGDIEMEYARMAMQYGQKAKEIRKVYERNDAVPELMAQIREQAEGA